VISPEGLDGVTDGFGGLGGKVDIEKFRDFRKKVLIE
jgi:hypothetical protein